MAEGEASSRLLREIFLAGFMSGLPADNASWASARLARNMSDVRLAADEPLYRIGEAPDSHYFIVTGAIRLEAPDKPRWILGERSLVGTLDLTLDRPRARDAYAERDSFLLRMPASDWLDMLEDNFELALRAVHGLSQSVHALQLELPDFDAEAATVAPATAALPPPLGFVDRVFVLQSLSLLAGGEMQALANLAERAEELTLEANQSLDPRHVNDALFVVVGGEVSASLPEGGRVRRYGPGQLVFGVAAASGVDLGYETTASEGTRVLRIAREDFYDVLEEHFASARATLKALATEREALVDEKERRAQGGT